MSIKSIIESPGQPKRIYRTGHTFHCFKCNLWVRWLGQNEMCSACQRETKTQDKIKLFQNAKSDGEA